MKSPLQFAVDYPETKCDVSFRHCVRLRVVPRPQNKGDTHRWFGFRERVRSISVSPADTFNREPEYICSKDPNELLRLFWEALDKRAKVLRELVRQEYMPEDFELLSKVQRATIRDWCDQIPVLAFNFGTYDPGSALTFSKMQSPFLASRCSIFCAERCRIKMDQSFMPQTGRHIKCSKRPLSAGQAWFSQGITKRVNRWFARTSVKVLRLDVNALYPSTMVKLMPWGPGKVVHYENPEEQKQKQFWRARCLTSYIM